MSNQDWRTILGSKDLTPKALHDNIDFLIHELVMLEFQTKLLRREIYRMRLTWEPKK
jgi:hypothetical protein